MAGSKHFKRDNSKNAGFASGSHKGCVKIIHCGCLEITKLLHICHVINYFCGPHMEIEFGTKAVGLRLNLDFDSIPVGPQM